ncbi:MAG: MlaD family protein [Bacteroidales bacterium]|jgi:phospholipid/cholesterol/gamma-HCH transport system substrate-binding protein|nr:MlaD family protein [Bacteroidales bacterium]
MVIRKEIKVGVIFVIALAILIWGLMYLKGLELLKANRTFFAVYDHVNGLVAANPISIKGLQVGQVKNLYFDKKNPQKIIVELYILGDYPIPVNSHARIFSSSLLGAKEVEIVPGDSKILAKDGDTLESSTEATLGEEVNKQLLPLKRKAENLISSIDSIAVIVQEVLNKNTRANLVMAIEHVKQTLENIAHTTHNLDTLMGSQRNNLAEIITNVESISNNLKKNNDKVTNILTNFSNISDSLAKARIPYTFAQVNKAITNLDSALQKINRGQGTIGQLINNDTLYKELEKAARDLNLLLEDIKTNPGRYVKVSVF